MDFAVKPVDFLPHLPDKQVKVFGEFFFFFEESSWKYSTAKNFFGLVKMTGYSFPGGQAGKLNIFAGYKEV